MEGHDSVQSKFCFRASDLSGLGFITFSHHPNHPAMSHVRARVGLLSRHVAKWSGGQAGPILLLLAGGVGAQTHPVMFCSLPCPNPPEGFPPETKGDFLSSRTLEIAETDAVPVSRHPSCPPPHAPLRTRRQPWVLAGLWGDSLRRKYGYSPVLLFSGSGYFSPVSRSGVTKGYPASPGEGV